MKKQLLYAFLGSLFLFTSCEVTINEGGESSSEKKGEEVKNGFSYEDLDYSVNGLLPVKTNEVVAGEYLVIEFSGVMNATLEEDFQHVGISIQIIDPSGEMIENSEDLMGNVEQQDSKLDFYHFYYGVPASFAGESFTMKFSLFDKYGDVSYDFEEEFLVLDVLPPATEGLDVNTNLEEGFITQIFSEEYQFENAPISVDAPFNIDLYLANLTGFTLTEEQTFEMLYSMLVIDEEGNEVLSQEDEFIEDVLESGYTTVNFYLNSGGLTSGNYTWKLEIKDKYNDKYLSVSTPIEIK